MLKCRSRKYELLKTDETTSCTTLFDPSTTLTRARPSMREIKTPSPKTPRRYATRGSRFFVFSSIFSSGFGTKPKSENRSSTCKKNNSQIYSIICETCLYNFSASIIFVSCLCQSIIVSVLIYFLGIFCHTYFIVPFLE